MQINNQAFQKTMSNLKADLPSVRDPQDTTQGPVPGAARPADRLSSNPAMMECLATAVSSVEVTDTNSVKMTQELPEKKSTTQGQAAEIARPAEGLIITAARMEQKTDAKEDMPVMMTQELPEQKSTTQGQAAEIAMPAEGLIITAARMEQNTDAKEDMPDVLQTITVEAVRMEEWPEEDSDKEMEAEMIKLQIEHEEEKDSRLKRVEMKRAEEESQRSSGG
jgi:hypothetical protein